MTKPKKITLNKTQCIAVQSCISARDAATANLNEVLIEAGLIPEMVETLNPMTGEVTLKGAVPLPVE